MKLKIVAGILILIFVFVLVGCNRQPVDLVYRFNYAIIQLPNGDVIEGKVENWRDYNDSDQLQVKIDGIYYLIHSVNCVLMTKERVEQK